MGPAMRGLTRVLVGLFPAAFRQKFGSEMLAQVEHDYDRARTRGLLPALGVAIRSAADLARSGMAETWNPTWSSAEPSAGRGTSGAPRGRSAARRDSPPSPSAR